MAANRFSLPPTASRFQQPQPIPKRMAFVVPEGKLSYAKYLSIGSFAALNPGWKTTVFVTPEIKQPSFCYGDLPVTCRYPFPSNAKIKYKGGDWLLRLKRFKGIESFVKANNRQLEVLADRGGFCATPDLLWIRPIPDEFYDAIADSRSVVPAFGLPGSLSPVVFTGGNRNSAHWLEAILCIVGGRDHSELPNRDYLPEEIEDGELLLPGMPQPEKPQVEKIRKWRINKIGRPGRQLCIIGLEVIFGASAYSFGADELPETCLAIPWLAATSIGHYLDSTVNSKNLSTFAGHTTWGHHAMKAAAEIAKASKRK